MLAAGGMVDGRPIVSRSTLEQMWTPQLTKEETGYGLGFMVGKFGKHRSISHNGAVYGHSASLVLLPDEKIGVVLLCNDDIVNGNVGRLANLA